MDYADFLAAKQPRSVAAGWDTGPLHPSLHEWQQQIVRWAARRRTAAIFADTGLGKTRMQVEWGRRFVGCELKPSYWRTAERNIRLAEERRDTPTLMDAVEAPA